MNKIEIKRPEIGISILIIFAALFITTFDNFSFWKLFAAAKPIHTGRDISFYIAMFVLITSFWALIFSFLSVKYLFKPALISIIIAASIIRNFSDKYGVIIDISMIQNIMQTDFKEASEIINFSLLSSLILYGLAPSFLIAYVKIKYKTFLKETAIRAVTIAVICVVIISLTAFFYKDLSLLGRQTSELRCYINPSYPVYSLVKYITKNHTPKRIISIENDAEQVKPITSRNKRMLTILVVGETARADNFSLNGYKRDTNPELSKEDVISFSNTYSCGTCTAESLPCMFSLFERKNYKSSKAAKYENLLDVLNHAGINVFWRDNNSGCKGVCDRVNYEAMYNMHNKDFCNSEECYDEILLYDLQKYIDNASGDILIALHQKGSHGPAYYKRHPESFTKFTPECSNKEVENCSTEEIINAYDNTILYTDHFLEEAIRFLKKNSALFDTGLWYMSDHGESLGENGVYLHGLPYVFAPDEQKHIPFILWLSDGLAQNIDADKACLKNRRDETYSHDNIFHSLIGMYHIKTDVYKSEFDIFRQCRKI